MKWYRYDMIDVQKCPSFCRNDHINNTLASLDGKTFHKEFL